ncbi:MAG: hypothetical protein KDA90_13045 [Planctomycetaceae bacterium]|nr:hypothetical protein [Planctomycetaceae bacterium]
MSSPLVLRITAPLVGVSLLLLGLGAFTAWYVHVMQQQATELLSQGIAIVEASHNVENQLRDLRTRLNKFVISGNYEHLQTADQLTAIIEQSLTATECLDLTPTSQATLLEIHRTYTLFADEFHQTLEKSPASERPRVILRLVDDLITRELIARAASYRESQEQRVAEASQRSQMIADRVSLTLLMLVTCGAIGGLIAGVGVAKSVQRSIVELNIPVHAAAGALNEVVGPVSVSTRGSIEGIRGSLDEMARQVATTVERLQDSQRESLRSEQLAAIGQLAAGLAHEIRNPLTAMKTIVQLARNQGGAAALNDKDVEILDEEITRLNDHVQIFLDYARPPNPRRQQVNLCDVIQRTVQLTTRRAEQQGITIRTSLPDHPVVTTADPDLLQQVVLNLVLNAIDAQPGGGDIELKLMEPPAETETGKIQIEFLDAGPGFRTESPEHLFDPFFSTKESGTGLGLAISRRIIEQHGGTITASNRPTGGARFTIEIPRDS